MQHDCMVVPLLCFQNHSNQIFFYIPMKDNNGNGCLPVAGFPLSLLQMG